MKTILVNVVSDQAMPNLRFIKEFSNLADSFLFITTRQMEQEGKTDRLIHASHISTKKSHRIIVSPVNMKEIEERMLDFGLSEEVEYLVNITGGTKPMSIVTLSVFSVFQHAKLFYIPIGEGTYRQVYPRIAKADQEFSIRISLQEYFESYGLILLEKENKLSKNYQIAKGLFDLIVANRGNARLIPDIVNAHQNNNPSDKSYYSGGWFEEFIYWEIKKKLNLQNTEIAYNVKLRNQKSKNEYDVVFIWNDSIYIVECKVFNEPHLREKVEKGLYKLGALDDDFGLKAHAVFVTTADIKGKSPDSNNSLSERAKSLNVKLFQLRDIINNKFLNYLE